MRWLNAAPLLLLASCATIIAPRHALLDVVSSPPGADVLVNGQRVGTTPTRIDYDSQRVPSLEVALQGYQTQTCRQRVSAGTGYVVADCLLCLFLFPFGCISFIDAGGAWNELDPPFCSVTLTPVVVPPAAYPPPQPPGYPAPPESSIPPQNYQPPPGYPIAPPPPPPNGQ